MKAYFLWLAKLITLLVLFFFAIPLLIAGVAAVSQQQLAASSGTDGKSVAVIELDGAIENSKDFIRDLRKQVENPSVSGVVVRVNSPGGAVGPSQDIFDAIKSLKAKKPIVASMGSIAASGGLYVAMGASKVFAQPGTLTGSIGVIMQFPNVSKVVEQYGVGMVTIKSGQFKDVGNMFREQGPEELAILQKTVDDVREQFVNAIVEGRGLAYQDVDKFADGRVFSGATAKELGLVDSLGGVVEAARAVYAELGTELPEGEWPAMFYPENKLDELSQYFSACAHRFAILFGALPRDVSIRYEWTL